MLRDQLIDIIDHAIVFGKDAWVGLEATGDVRASTNVNIRSCDEAKEVLLLGELLIPDLPKPEVFGLGSLGDLRAQMNHPAMESGSATTKFDIEADKRVLQLSSKVGQYNACVKTWEASLVPNMKYKGTEATAKFSVAPHVVDQFSKMLTSRSDERYFYLDHEDGEVFAYIGKPERATHTVRMKVADCKAWQQLNHKYQAYFDKKHFQWIKGVINLDQSNWTYNDKGALIIEHKTDYGTYRYLIRHKKG